MTVGKSFAHGTAIEAKFHALASKRGWQTHRSGWPDFFIVNKGRAMFVEVKSKGDWLRASQRSMFEALEVAGVSVMVWWEAKPEHLMSWRKFRRERVLAALAARKRSRAVAKSRNPGMYRGNELRRLEREVRRMG